MITSILVDEVRMWVYEEILPCGEKLSEHINRTKVPRTFATVTASLSRILCIDCPLFILQVNAKYLPKIHLGDNVVADPDLENAGN